MQYYVVGLLLISIILCSGWFIFFYDKAANKKAKIEDIGRQINELMKQKHDLIGECVETVCSSAKHQEEIPVMLLQLRNDLLNTQTPDESIKISKELKELLKIFFMNKGACLDIEAEHDFLNIWQQVEEMEKKLALIQQLFHEEVFLYNKSIKKFPNVIASKIMNIKQIMVPGSTH